MKVMLIAHTPEPEKIVATAAKLCYSSSDISSLKEGLTEEKTRSFIEMLASIGHESVFEHVSITCLFTSAGPPPYRFLLAEESEIRKRERLRVHYTARNRGTSRGKGGV